ncbi:MAG: proline dehydrogenase family protein [Bdellovibrionaceae bacterium]|nr:proline dehydrogenase family protein [Pseudobdellovibrionaceae bacterium]
MQTSEADQKRIVEIGSEILKKMESNSKVSLFSKDFWYGSIMDWSMKNETFKTNMFRFVDVLPSLNSSNDVAQHLKEYFTEGGSELPSVFNVGLGLGSLAPGLMAGAIKKNVTQMAKMFITGENPNEALPVLKKMRKNNLTFTVDILGEATLSEKEASEYSNKYQELMDGLAKDADKWDLNPLLDTDAEGPLPKVNVSVKMSALYSQINDRAWEETKTILKDRLRPLFKKAMERNIFLNLDMEQYSVKHLTVEVFKELLIETELRSYKFFGCVIQAYLRDSSDDIRDLCEFAKIRKTPFTVRLVKGAYWDYETIDSEQKNWTVPVYTIKAESDANYEVCAKILMDNYPHIKAAFASHNVRTLAACLHYAQLRGIPKNGFEIQMLFGMAEPIKKTFADMGYRVREYAPVGELIPGMAYLVRRLLENTSNESWLRGKFAENKTMDELLADPITKIPKPGTPPAPGQYTSTAAKHSFQNEPLEDFAVESNRRLMHEALKKFNVESVKTVIPEVNFKALTASEFLNRENPSQANQIVARIGLANKDMAEMAIQESHKAFHSWKKTSPKVRADYIRKLAQLMRTRKWDLMATQIYEVGKPWAEADGDIGEAIDFCNYYAVDMEKIGHPQRVGGVPGETSHYIYKPRGVCLVIAPWNFPLAILCGQVAAALVTGNTVIMKPAEQSSLMAQNLYQMLKELNLPAGVVQFLPGLGEVVGEYLVNHPLTSTIAFTGSMNVGLHILNKSSIPQKGQDHVKRCIIEMGGKNAVIIDSDADLDEAVDAIVYSAFGFAGQKCSAASRCIVLDDVYEKFSQRLVEATRSISVGSVLNPKNYLGPVVDKEAYDRINGLIKKYSAQHKVLQAATVNTDGYFVSPTIFGDVPADSDLAQEEIFGPVLALIKAKDIDEALKFANGTKYALTGGLFSRSPANIQKVRHEFEVGNLYINRGITGAMVDRHPFGGFKMSGVGSKTGGPDYLKQFMEPICVTENTLRRGFAPQE